MIYLQMFIAFFQIGLFSFGGGYAAVPLIQHQIIEINGWLDLAEFADLITISEMTPGPIVLNCATFVGQQVGQQTGGLVGGILGAVICTLGSVMPSLIVVLILSALYMRYRNLRMMQGILTGLRPAIVSMIAAAGLSILLLAIFNSDFTGIQLSNFRMIEAVLFIAGLVASRKFKLNPILVIFGSGIIGYGVYQLAGLFGA